DWHGHGAGHASRKRYGSAAIRETFGKGQPTRDPVDRRGDGYARAWPHLEGFVAAGRRRIRRNAEADWRVRLRHGVVARHPVAQLPDVAGLGSRSLPAPVPVA